jgi:hypothetical protein
MLHRHRGRGIISGGRRVRPLICGVDRACACGGRWSAFLSVSLTSKRGQVSCCILPRHFLLEVIPAISLAHHPNLVLHRMTLCWNGIAIAIVAMVFPVPLPSPQYQDYVHALISHPLEYCPGGTHACNNHIMIMMDETNYMLSNKF